MQGTTENSRHYIKNKREKTLQVGVKEVDLLETGEQLKYWSQRNGSPGTTCAYRPKKSPRKTCSLQPQNRTRSSLTRQKTFRPCELYSSQTPQEKTNQPTCGPALTHASSHLLSTDTILVVSLTTACKGWELSTPFNLIDQLARQAYYNQSRKSPLGTYQVVQDNVEFRQQDFPEQEA